MAEFSDHNVAYKDKHKMAEPGAVPAATIGLGLGVVVKESRKYYLNYGKRSTNK